MKKLIVLLLALAMVAGAYAQVTTSISLSGEVTLVDEAGKGVFTRYGNGYDTWTFKASDKDGKYGISLTDQNILDDGGFVLRDWNFWWKGQFTKVILGKLRNADFRMTVPYWASATIFGGTDRISDYGVLIETLPKNGLTFGVNLPFGTTAANTVDVLQNADLGVKYDVKGLGTFVALFNADFVAPAGNVLNLGGKITSVKNLTAVGIARLAFDADTYKAALGFAYSGIDKLAANLEAAFTYTAGAIAYSVWGQGAYSLSDKMTATVGGSYADTGYDVYANLGYDYGNGLSSEVGAGFNGALYAAAKLYYSVSF